MTSAPTSQWAHTLVKPREGTNSEKVVGALTCGGLDFDYTMSANNSMVHEIE